MYIKFISLLVLTFPSFAFSFENIKIQIDEFSINKYEITIKEFKEFAERTGLITEAEKTGGGYEWGIGWEKEPIGITKLLMAKLQIAYMNQLFT